MKQDFVPEVLFEVLFERLFGTPGGGSVLESPTGATSPPAQSRLPPCSEVLFFCCGHTTSKLTPVLVVARAVRASACPRQTPGQCLSHCEGGHALGKGGKLKALLGEVLGDSSVRDFVDLGGARPTLHRARSVTGEDIAPQHHGNVHALGNCSTQLGAPVRPHRPCVLPGKCTTLCQAAQRLPT